MRARHAGPRPADHFPVDRRVELRPDLVCVIVVIVLEMGLISPPVGVNVFVVKSIAGDVPMGHIVVGIMPFWLAMGGCLLTLVLFPEIATFLFDRMFN